MRHLAALTLLTAAALAGCASPPTAGPAPAGPTTVQPPSLAPSDFQAPPVTGPLKTDRLRKTPCAAIAAEQLTALGVEEKGVEQRNQSGLGCQWRYGGDGTIDLLWSGDAGLDIIYQSRHLSAYFEPLPELDGYPAVTSERHDNRVTGACSIHVGTADTAMFTIAVQQPRDQVDTPCSTATAAASAVLSAAKNG